jgi:hypothetical protein
VTQTEQIRAHLVSGRDITPLEAFRLAARVADLRAEGLDVQTITEERNGKRYARYRLVGQLALV